jgi:hypothetical protein
MQVIHNFRGKVALLVEHEGSSEVASLGWGGGDTPERIPSQNFFLLNNHSLNTDRGVYFFPIYTHYLGYL